LSPGQRLRPADLGKAPGRPPAQYVTAYATAPVLVPGPQDEARGGDAPGQYRPRRARPSPTLTGKQYAEPSTLITVVWVITPDPGAGLGFARSRAAVQPALDEGVRKE